MSIESLGVYLILAGLSLAVSPGYVMDVLEEDDEDRFMILAYFLTWVAFAMSLLGLFIFIVKKVSRL